MHATDRGLATCAPGALLCLVLATSLAAAGDDDFRPLLNGRDLSGWKAEGGGKWTVSDGVLTGTNVATEPRHGHLFLTEEVGDFTIRLKFKSVRGNSGLYFRTEKTEGDVGIKGFQAEIDAANDIGGLYETHGRAWVVKPDAALVKTFFKPGEWNDMTVTAKGRDVTVTVNGVTTAELKNDRGRTKGLVALQIHGGQDVEVRFKDIEIRR